MSQSDIEGETNGSVVIQEEVIEQLIGEVDALRLLVVEHGGASLIVDREPESIDDNALYRVRSGGGIEVRRLQRVADGQLVLIKEKSAPLISDESAIVAKVAGVAPGPAPEDW